MDALGHRGRLPGRSRRNTAAEKHQALQTANRLISLMHLNFGGGWVYFPKGAVEGPRDEINAF